MLRLFALSAILVVACIADHHDDFGGQDESRIEAILREQGFSEKEIADLLQEDAEDRHELAKEDDDEEYVSWSEAKGYNDCKDPEFMWWKNKKEGSWKGSDNEVLRNRRHHGNKGGHKKGYKGKKGEGCPKPKPLSVVCAENECPKWERLNISGCGFEARKIFGAKWVTTEIDLSGTMEEGYKAAFWRLFKFISGANDQSTKIDMTVPVINKWFMNDAYEVVGASMSFYLPSAHQDSPPAPTDASVVVESWGDAVVYDRAFGGHRMDDAVYTREFELLWKALAKSNITPFTGMSITAGYTRPGWGRQRQEVMFLDQDSV